MKLKMMIGIGCLAACVVCPTAFAQDEYAPFEMFAGYNLVRSAVYGGTCPLDRVFCDTVMGNMNGWNIALAGNINSIIGIKGEISGAFYSTGNDIAKLSDYSFMAGPQVNWRIKAFPGTLFGHSLFGARTRRAILDGSNEDYNRFEIAWGGGIDWGKGRVGMRAPQIDYFPRRNRGIVPFYNYRISTGIVLRFGS